MTSYPALRELAEKATAGPWTNNWTGDDPMTVVSSAAVGVLADCGRAVLYSGTVNPQANADFIAACDPQTILSLLDEIDRLREALNEIANYKPKAFDFAAPTEIATFCRDRASQALRSTP